MSTTIVILLLIILMLLAYKKDENLTSPGYSNRFNISANIPNTYGGTNANFTKDPRFSV